MINASRGLIHRHTPLQRAVITASASAIFVFLYAPLFVLVLFSFNESKILAFPITDLTWKWYAGMLENRDIHRSIVNSVIVVSGAVPGALVIGVPIAMALSRIDFPGKAVLERLIVMPLIVPGLITGLSLLLVFKQLTIPLSLLTVILGHAVVWLPIIVLQVYARLRRLDPRLEAASLDLGATPWQTFWRVTLPNIRNSILGSSLLAATLSLNDVSVTFFLTGSESTLPMLVWSMLRRGVVPEINAIATISMMLSVVALVLAIRMLRAEES